MLRFSKPPHQPANFGDNVKTAHDDILAIIKRGDTPMSADFADKWKSFKAVLFKAQHFKCGYCELFLATHPGDVEHYRPKAELQELPDDETQWGEELKDVFNVVGRLSYTCLTAVIGGKLIPGRTILLPAVVATRPGSATFFLLTRSPAPPLYRAGTRFRCFSIHSRVKTQWITLNTTSSGR